MAKNELGTAGWSGEAISNLKIWISNVGQQKRRRPEASGTKGRGKGADPAKLERDANCALEALRASG